MTFGRNCTIPFVMPSKLSQRGIGYATAVPAQMKEYPAAAAAAPAGPQVICGFPGALFYCTALHGRHKAAHGSYKSACVNASCSLTISLVLPHLGKHRPCIALLSSVRKPNVEH